MTPACRFLKQQKINHSTHEYQHDDDNRHFGQEAVAKLGLRADEVFKTLLVCDGKRYYVAVLPVAYRLNLKKMALALGIKKLEMADAQAAQRLTGYVLGGISPLAQKKRLPTIIDDTAKNPPKIYVSGGRRGLQIGISPYDLAQAVTARFADIIDGQTYQPTGSMSSVKRTP